MRHIEPKFIHQGISTKFTMISLAWPVKILFALLGKCPFTTEKKDGTSGLVYSYPLVIMAVLSKIGLIGVIIWSLIVYPWPKADSISLQAQRINIVVWYVAAGAIAVSGTFSMNKQLKIYQKIYDISQDTNENLNDENKKQKKFEVYAVTGLLLLYTLGYFGMIVSELWSSGSFLVISYGTVCLEYLIAAIEIYCFQLIICKILTQCENGLTSLNVKKVSELYIAVSNISKEFNDIYWLQVFLLAVGSTICVLFDSFEFGRILISNGKGHLEANGIKVSHTVYIFGFFLILFMLSSMGTKKNDQTKNLLLKARTLVLKSQNAYKEDFDFLISSTSDLPMNLSAGFFDINYSFLTTVSINIITFLVILLDFPSEGANETSATLKTATTALNTLTTNPL